MRDGLNYILTRLKTACQINIEGAVVEDTFTDDELIEILDMYRQDITEKQLLPRLERSGVSGYKTLRYYFPSSIPFFIEGPETVGAFKVVTYDGTEVTGYTWDKARYIEFSTDQNQAEYYLTCVGFNFGLAAAQVWYQKAARRAWLINWKSNGLTLNEDQEYQHCMEMCKLFLGNDNISVLTDGISSSAVKFLKRVGYERKDTGFSQSETPFSPASPFA